MTRNTDAAQLRKFGLLVGGVFSAIGLWPIVVRGAGPRSWALVVGVLLLSSGAPRAVGPDTRLPDLDDGGRGAGMDQYANPPGRRLLGLITPMGLIRRLWSEDPMRRRHDPAAQSYRVPKPPRPGAHMNRQF